MDAQLKTLLVTSSSPSEGKTTVIANLACAIAQSWRTAVIVDADLRRPKVHKILQLNNRVGLTDAFIQKDGRIEDLVQTTGVKKLFAITSGSLPPNPAELMGSEKMLDILGDLSGKVDRVLLDTPPALVVTDANELASHVDGVIIVVRPGITKRAAPNHEVAQLRQVKAKIMGVVLNNVNVKSSRYYYGGHYYSNYGHETRRTDSTVRRSQAKGQKASGDGSEADEGSK